MMLDYSRQRIIVILVVLFGLTLPVYGQEAIEQEPLAPEPSPEMTADKADEAATPDFNEEQPEDIEIDESIIEDEAAINKAKIVAAPGVANFKGRVLERGTKRPVVDVTVYLKGTEFEATTDADGNFRFRDLPADIYNPTIPTMDYESFVTSEVVRDGEVVEVTYYLEPKRYGVMEVVVHGKRETKEVSRRVLTKDEIMVIPGAQGDAVRVVESLPGVARGGTSSDGVAVRGSNMEDSRVLVDGHDIPMLFHFGGVKSVYNSELLDEVNLITGGFDAKYGNATGGVVELETRDPRTDRWGGYADLSFIDASAMAEGPVAEDMGIALALRRSTVDLVLPFVVPDTEEFKMTTYPVYYDYQAKWSWQINDEHSLSIDTYGLYDDLKFWHDSSAEEEPELTGAFGITLMSHSAFVNYKVERDGFTSEFSPGYNFIMNKIKLGDKYFLESKAHVFQINEDVRVDVAKEHTLRLGANIEPRILQIDSNFIRPPKEGDVSASFANSESLITSKTEADAIVGLYIADDMVYGPVTIVPGLRFDYESFLDIYSVSPRLAVRWQVVEPFLLKMATGLFSRIPDADEIIEPYGNGGLEFERSVHAVTGFEWDIVQGLTLDVQGYYKYMFDMVNALDKTDSDSDDIYANNAKGYAFGGEIFMKYRYQDVFFGWVSYSVSQAMRNDGPGTDYRLFDMDQTHNLIVVASWQFAKGWRLGGRFQYTSGEPYTDVDGSIKNADNGSHIPLYDSENKNGSRRNPFHRLDIRLDKEWVFNTWILHAYLDVENVYYHANPIETAYNYDYTETAEVTGLPILPSIGIKAEF